MEILNNILWILVLIEMIFIHCFMVDLFFERKMAKWKVTLVCLVVGVVLLTVSFLLIPDMSENINLAGCYILLGVIFLIPLGLCYKVSIKKLILVSLIVWIYISLGLFLGIFVSFFFNDYHVLITFIVQTSCHVLYLILFRKFIYNIFIRIFEEMDSQVELKFLITSFITYATLIAGSYALIFNDYDWIKLCFVVLFGVDVSMYFSIIINLIDVTQSRKTMRTMVYIDGITKLPNRNAFIADFNEKVEKNDKFCIVFIDLDRFKSINDEHGHNAGNRYLKFFADYVKEYFPEDFFYRIYGDEFLLLSNDEKFEIEQKMKHCQKAIKKEKFLNGMFLGFSFGTVSYPDDGVSREELVMKADQKMYSEKQGKTENRIFD